MGWVGGRPGAPLWNRPDPRVSASASRQAERERARGLQAVPKQRVGTAGQKHDWSSAPAVSVRFLEKGNGHTQKALGRERLSANLKFCH